MTDHDVPELGELFAAVIGMILIVMYIWTDDEILLLAGLGVIVAAVGIDAVVDQIE